MYYVYIIRSKNRNWNYVGITSNIQQRLLDHNKGLNRSTRARRPFNLIFAQMVETRVEARELEKYLKVRFNKEALLEVISATNLG